MRCEFFETDAGVTLAPFFTPFWTRQNRRNLLSHKTSGRQDLNLRLPAPKAGALPDCATPRTSSGYQGPSK